MLVARAGQGDMAVSNAFGSNVFNILVGLGLPWLLYIVLEGGGAPYEGIVDEGVAFDVAILALVLAGFTLALALARFTLNAGAAYTMLALYVAYLSYAVATGALGVHCDLSFTCARSGGGVSDAR